MKKIIGFLGIALLGMAFLGLSNNEIEKSSLKFIFIKNGELHDAKYRPCKCKQSLWDEAGLITLESYNKEEIEQFIKYTNNCSSSKKAKSYANFSNAFIISQGKCIDTIYTDNDFQYFTKPQYQDNGFNFQQYDCYRIADSSKMIPNNFLREYLKIRYKNK